VPLLVPQPSGKPCRGSEEGTPELAAGSSTIEDGVASTLRLALSPELEGVSARFFDRLQEGRANEQAYDPTARRRLWQLSEELVRATPLREG
jgi:hypothetical protein